MLLLLLIPLLISKYNNSLVYDPNPASYDLDDKTSELRMLPSLHEYTKKYINKVNSEGLKRVTYSISGDFLKGLSIDSKTGIISGHPERAGTYTYEVVMKHSKGKFKGEVTIDVTEKGRPAEKEEEPEPEIAGAANPEPENTKSKPKFKDGAGTKMDPFVITLSLIHI